MARFAVTSSTSEQQTTTFADSEMGMGVALPIAPDPTRSSLFRAADVSLAKFFERPIVATTFAWTPAQVTPFYETFDPWTLFFENPRVANRLTNYNLMRSNLHVRFIINGNGFYYGRLMADYAPLPSTDDVTSYSNSTVQNAIQASQRMKVFIDPSHCCATEMYLPFVWHRDAINPTSNEWNKLGSVYIRQLAGLKHANASVQPITITVMVWATEVELSVPTSVDIGGLVAQAGEGDEYGTTPISSTATAVASAADTLATIPTIAPFMRATSMAATGVGRLARAFGFSRPPDIGPLMPMRPQIISSLALTDAPDVVAKLTVDSKQELAIDPRIMGLDLPDELGISSIAARESYLTSFAWTTTAVAGNLLWNTRVTPYVCGVATNYYLPACMFAAAPFYYWRGKMQYRFQIVSSDYHRGRIRLVWDPNAVATLESNIQYTRVIDISTEKDVTVEVDWGQPQAYCTPSSFAASGSNYGTTTLAASTTEATNGVLAMYVLNDLATPNSVVNNDITVNVFVSCNDMQVAYPLELPNYINTYSATVQAGEEAVGETDAAMGGNMPCAEGPASHSMGDDADTDQLPLVYYGERILSFRTLLRRYNLHSSIVVPLNSSATAYGTWGATLPCFPPYAGYNSTTMHVDTAGTAKYNYVQQTLLAYLVPAFVAVRGSMRSKYVAHCKSNSDMGTITIMRAAVNGAISLPTTQTATPITSQRLYAYNSKLARSACAIGAFATSTVHQPSLEVEFPYYKNVRFDHARTLNATVTDITNPMALTHKVEVVSPPSCTSNTVLDRYVSVGEDFSLWWFQGCPPIKALAIPV